MDYMLPEKATVMPVEKLFDYLGENPSGIENAAIKKGLYDTAIGLLVARLAPV
jgi:hypothetical protein